MIYDKNLIESFRIESKETGIGYVILDNLFNGEFIKKCEKEPLILRKSGLSPKPGIVSLNTSSLSNSTSSFNTKHQSCLL